MRAKYKMKCKVLDREKSAHFNRGINEAVKALSKHSLFNVIDSFLMKKPSLKLPRHNSLAELVVRFSSHFTNKIRLYLLLT